MYSKKIQRLSNDSKELIKKWNEIYFFEISACFQEHMNVLEGIKKNFKIFQDTLEKNSNNNTSDYIAKKNTSFIQTIVTYLINFIHNFQQKKS